MAKQLKKILDLKVSSLAKQVLSKIIFDNFLLFIIITYLLLLYS